MKANVNMRHPRLVKEGKLPKDQSELVPIPLCIETGSLTTIEDRELCGLDELGIAVSIYFKLLKSLITFFMVCTTLCIPLFFVYSAGNFNESASTEWQKVLSEWTIGNLGESSRVCKERDVRLYDTMKIQCPPGTIIQSLDQFGLQKSSTSKTDKKQCDIVNKDQSESKIELDEYCQLNGLE